MTTVHSDERATPMVASQPLPPKRHAHLLAALERNGSVRVAEMAEELGVTPVTVRRDIAQLESEGRLVRVHGGAIAVPGGTPYSPGVDSQGGPTVGVIVPTLSVYWPEVIQNLESEAQCRGVRLITRSSSYDAVDERPLLDRLTKHDDVDGLILAPRTDGPGAGALARWLTESTIPAVLIEREVSRTSDHDLIESVSSDHALGARMAVHHLALLGHRRVGLVLSTASPTSRKIAAGWRTACVELGLASNEHFERLTPSRDTPEFGNVAGEVVDMVFATGTTGLLVHSDPEAFGVVQKALERGLSVPGDLSIIAYDDTVADILRPRMTAVRPPRDAVAATAVERVLRRISDPGLPYTRALISPRLNVRETTGPAPSARRKV